jgi:hypothetical protein
MSLLVSLRSLPPVGEDCIDRGHGLKVFGDILFAIFLRIYNREKMENTARERGITGFLGGSLMIKFFLWLILLVLCWPLALLALLLYPIVWLLLLPFRLLGITVNAAFDLLKAIITLPARVLRGGRK